MKLLLACLLISIAALAQEPGPEPARAPVCPLSESQTQKSIEAFSKIAAFLTKEPRCVNCHGGVNPYIDGTGPDPEDPNAPPSSVEHGGGKMAHEQDSAQSGLVDSGCASCHSHMAPRGDGSPSVWMTAPGFLSFIGKDAPTLCKQIKRSSGDAKHFLGHVKNDNAGNNFTGTAYNGDRGLDRTMYPESEVPTQKPGISHAQLLKLAQDWVDAMGGQFKGDQECGCVPSAYSLRLSAETVIHDQDIEYKSTMPGMDIPIKFDDDGSFYGQGKANFQSAGVVADCALQAAANRTFSVSGNATEDENEHSMHFSLKSESPLNASGSYQCSDISGAASRSIWSDGTWPFSLRGEVGEVLVLQMPSPDPVMTNTARVEVMKKDQE